MFFTCFTSFIQVSDGGGGEHSVRIYTPECWQTFAINVNNIMILVKGQKSYCLNSMV